MTSIRLLHTADWHLGRKLEGRSRHNEQQLVLQELCDIVDAEAVDGVIVAGDIFDNYNPPIEAESLYYETIARLANGGRRAVIVIAGNHDSPDRLVAANSYAQSLGIITLGRPNDTYKAVQQPDHCVNCIASGPAFIRLRLPASPTPISVLAIPYPSESRLMESMTTDIVDEHETQRNYNRRLQAYMNTIASSISPDEVLITTSHLYVTGGHESESERQIQVGGIYSVSSTSFPAHSSYIALGHLHRPQEISGHAGQTVRYSGSILQYGFGEAGDQKSVTILEIDHNAVTHRIVPLTSGRTLRQLITTASELDVRLNEVNTNEWIWLNLRVQEPFPPEQLQNILRTYPGIIRLTTTYTTATPELAVQKNIADLPLQDQFKSYVESRFDEQCDSSVLRLFLELATSPDDRDVLNDHTATTTD